MYREPDDTGIVVRTGNDKIMINNKRDNDRRFVPIIHLYQSISVSLKTLATSICFNLQPRELYFHHMQNENNVDCILYHLQCAPTTLPLSLAT